jgi:signal transduction histidine kinase
VTIRTRLTMWYAVILVVSLFVIGLGTFRELDEQMRDSHRRKADEEALGETGEMLLRNGLPAILLGLIGGWWLMRRALAPVAALTDAAEKLHEQNLHQPLPRTNNGDELDRLAEVLNGMTARLDTSFHRIREFTLHASHELKTPLTVLHGETETALRENQLSPGERDRLLSQLDELQRLSKVVDGLTLLTKADAGLVKLNKEPVRLDELVRDAHADAQILAEPNGIKVSLKHCDPVTVAGDRHRLRQLLLNLVDNALKYNRPDGSVSIALSQNGEGAELCVANTGPGIPPEKLPRVFERFFRGDAAHGNQVDGCGLGLSIAQWIASAHDGTIAIESEPERLTTVTVHLRNSHAANAA